MKRLLPCFLILMVLLVVTATGSEADEKLILATYKLANEKSTATCLAVSRQNGDGKGGKVEKFVVTANHVFSQMAGDSCLLVSRVAVKNGTYNRREIRIDIRKDEKDLWKKHPRHDLAVLRLPDKIDIKALPFTCLADEASLKKVHGGDDVRLAVFPEQSEANGAGIPILRSGSIASYPFTPVEFHAIFLVDTNAWPGDSGGPVIHESLRSKGGNPLVLGFVHGKRSITDTVKESRFVEKKTHYPLGISEVMHAAFVRELFSESEAKGED